MLLERLYVFNVIFSSTILKASMFSVTVAAVSQKREIIMDLTMGVTP